MYYPWRDIEADLDYEGHLEYKWFGENVRSMVLRRAKSEDVAEDDIKVFKGGCNSKCLSYAVKAGAKVRRACDVRQWLWMRGFRCNLVYACPGSRLNVTPLFASRTQALRWGIDLWDIVVFVGDKGDTDHEYLLGGLHKSVILNGTVEFGSERLLRSNENFKRGDVMPGGSIRIAIVEEGLKTNHITSALTSLQVK